MKRLNHTLWLLFIAVALVSCGKEKEDCDPEDEESPCFPGYVAGGKLLLVEAKEDGWTYMKHEYDNQNRATATYFYGMDGSVNVTVTYSYVSGDTPKTVRYKTKSGDIAVEEYALSADGRPTSMVQSQTYGGRTTYVDHTYQYSKNTMVETMTHRKERPSDPESVYVNTYTYDGMGNLQSVVLTFNGEWTSTMEHGDFDDKFAPDKYGNPTGWKNQRANNPRSIKTTVPIEGVVDDEIWSYTYNAAGYPVTAEVVDRRTNTPIAAHTFHYKPAK